MSVLLTGATGYIGHHIIDQLLPKGYPVVAAVRSASKGQQLCQEFVEKHPNSCIQYEVVPDIGAAGALDAAVRNHPEVKYLIHTASPVIFGVQGEEADERLLRPALQGTRNAFTAAKNFGPQIERIVLTSSIGAMIHWDQAGNPKFIHTEDTWGDLKWEDARETERLGYSASKQYAERAAWEFMEKEKPNFTLTVTNPAFVYGPHVFSHNAGIHTGVSADMVTGLLETKPGDTHKFASQVGPFIDVRDVAKAHVMALEKDWSGHRLFLAEEDSSDQAVLNIINNRFPELRGKIAVGQPDSVGDADFQALRLYMDNSRTKQLLGWKLISLEDSVVDTVKQVLDKK